MRCPICKRVGKLECKLAMQTPSTVFPILRAELIACKHCDHLWVNGVTFSRIPRDKWEEAKQRLHYDPLINTYHIPPPEQKEPENGKPDN